MLKSLTILVLASIPLFGNFAHGVLFIGPYSRCDSVVDQQLDRLNVDRADIEKLFYTRQYGRGISDDTVVVGVDAWVRFKSCKGYLVIDMTRQCHVRQAYTRGQCRVPGVKSFC